MSANCQHLLVETCRGASPNRGCTCREKAFARSRRGTCSEQAACALGAGCGHKPCIRQNARHEYPYIHPVCNDVPRRVSVTHRLAIGHSRARKTESLQADVGSLQTFIKKRWFQISLSSRNKLLLPVENAKQEIKTNHK